MNHAADQLAFSSHFSIHGKTKTFHPKSEAFFEIGAGDYGDARFHCHISVVYY
jgi:hypothetical protein